MTRPARKPLQERLAEIERRLEVLETVVRSSPSAGVVPPDVSAAAAPSAPALGSEAMSPSPLPRDVERRPLDVERLFRWAGAVLLVLAAAFLVGVAIDRGWLTPWVRLVGGFAIGVSLMGIGAVLRRRSDAFATTLLSAGAIIAYLMVWAGHQAFGLIGPWVAAAGMVLVVLALFTEVFRSNDVSLSVLGTLGGFTAPFLLAISGPDLADTTGVPLSLVLYLAAFVVLTAVVHAAVGWRLLQVAAAGSAILGGSLLITSGISSTGAGSDALVVSLYFVLVAVAYWAVPAVLRPGIERRRTGREPVHAIARAVDDALDVLVRIAGFALLPIVLVVLGSQWGMDPVEMGRTALVLAVASGIVGALASELDDVINWLLAAAMLAIGLVLVLDEDFGALALVAEGAAILVANRFARGHRANAVAGHVLVGLGTLAAGVRLLAAFGEAGAAVPVVAAIVVVLLAGAGWAAEERMRPVWWAAGYAGVLLVVRHLLGDRDVGVGVTTGTWAVIGLGLVLAGRRRSLRPIELAGLVTLGAVALRLVEHLGDLEPLVRVVVFLGIGALLLLGGWYVRPRDVDAAGADEGAHPPGA